MTLAMKRLTLPTFVFVAFIAAWQFGVQLTAIPEYLLPAPSTIFYEFFRQPNLPTDFAITGLEALAGFFLGSGAAILGGVILYSSRTLEAGLTPFAIGMKTVPIVAIAPLLVTWFGFGLTTKIALAALICFFPALINTVQGLKDVDRSQTDLFATLAASRVATYRFLLFPAAALHIFAALRVTVVLAVIGAIVAEFAGATSGLGFRIIVASYHLDTPAMFVYIVATAFLGLILYGVVVFVERLAVPWAHKYRR